jgi:recombination protein RecT
MPFDDNQKSVIASLLPKYLSPERFFSLCQLAERNYALRECTPQSILGCFIQAAEIGLEPNTPLKHCWLIPFRNAKTGKTYATLVIGWQGLIHKAIMCGAATKVVANVVRTSDTLFKYRPLDRRDPILHEPDLAADDDDVDGIIGAYTVWFLPDGEVQAEYMSRTQIDRIRDRSKAKNEGPWVTDTAEMMRKCPTRRGSKYLRMTGNLDEVQRFGKTLEIDNLFDSGSEDDEPPPQIAAGTPEPQRTVNPEPPRRGRPPKQDQNKPQSQPAPATVPPRNAGAASATTQPQPAPTPELCGFCHKPGHTFNECPENRGPSQPILEARPNSAAPQTGVRSSGGDNRPPTTPSNNDRVLSAAEYDDLFNDARKAHPNRTATWLASLLEDNFGLNDLGDLKVSQIPKLSELMLTQK